jgi:hypothetical protein
LVFDDKVPSFPCEVVIDLGCVGYTSAVRDVINPAYVGEWNRCVWCASAVLWILDTAMDGNEEGSVE